MSGPSPTSPSIQGLGTDLELEVAGKKLAKAVAETIVATSLILTAQGSSTITCVAKDPQRLLVKSGWFSSKAEAHLDGLPFKACAFKKKVDEETLEFEDRDFWLMKEGPHARDRVKVLRGHKTLAEFVAEQVRRLCPHTNFVCPQLKQVQPREPEKVARTVQGAKGAPAPGISGSFNVEGKAADAEQKKMANILLGACTGAPPIVAVAILCAGIGESTLRNLTTPNPLGYWGVLQGGSGAGRSAPNFPKVPDDQTAKEMAECFVKGGRGFQGGGAAALARGGKTDPGEIATLVEASGEPPDYYGKYKGEAEGIIKAYGGNPGGSTSKTTMTVTPEFFELNQKVNTNEEPEEENENEENALSGVEAYLKPGKWLFWKVGNTFYLYTEKYLAKCKPVAHLSEETPGILDIGYDLDHSKKKVSKVIIECRALLWTVPAGQLVSFEDSVGEAVSRDNKGHVRRWIVLNIERKDITDNATTVELILPEQGKKEKAASAKELTVVTLNPKTGNHENALGPDGKKLERNSLIWQAYAQALWISDQHYYYRLGGGHAGFHATVYAGETVSEAEGTEGQTVPTKLEGLDCSGAVSWALHSAGLWESVAGQVEAVPGAVRPVQASPMNSSELEGWGDPGEGKYITVWTNADHCFLWIRIPGSMRPEGGPDIDYALEASHTGATVPHPHGVGLRPRAQSYPNPAAEGFKARHWPGT
jgi:hypothetical protein